MTDLTRNQLADRLGLSSAVIRKWERLFSEYLVSAGGVKGVARARTYPDEDVVLFSIVAAMRNEGLSLDAIGDLLPERLANARAQLGEGLARTVDYLPASTDKGQLALYEAVRQLEAVTGTLAAVEEERDYLRGRIVEMEGQLNDATARAVAAEVERDMLAGRGVGWWQRFLEKMRGGTV